MRPAYEPSNKYSDPGLCATRCAAATLRIRVNKSSLKNEAAFDKAGGFSFGAQEKDK
jgi:hypothetical protein